jgi:riboflavin kinase, archaea type
MQLALSGKVFSGIGKGRYYVGHPEYQARFEEKLGYKPYPGTLNVKLEDRVAIEEMRTFRSLAGTKIDSFTVGEESFSALNCFDGKLKDERVTLLLIEITYYNETVAELISPAFLRGKFGFKDGDPVTFNIDIPDPTQGRQ